MKSGVFDGTYDGLKLSYAINTMATVKIIKTNNNNNNNKLTLKVAFFQSELQQRCWSPRIGSSNEKWVLVTFPIKIRKSKRTW